MDTGKIAFRSVVFLFAAVYSCMTALAQDKVSFSGKVSGNVGCLEILPAPIPNAKVRVYPDQSCMINALPKKGGFSSSCIESTFTDASGKYRFENLDPDSFVCSSIIVEVEATGYFKQRRYIFPELDSLLHFSLIGTSGDSIYPVAVTVYAVDTNVHCGGAGYCSPQPLANYQIGISDPLLSWLSRIKDTTDENGKAEFTQSAVPKVDYLISAKAQGGSYYSGGIITNIASCGGNDVTIYIHIPRTRAIPKAANENAFCSIECVRNSLYSKTVMKIQTPAFKVQGRRISVRMVDIKGSLAGCVAKNAGQSKTGSSLSFTWNASNLPAGIYLLNVDNGSESFSKTVLLRR